VDYRNILIVKLSAIGDVIHALPVAHALKQQFPTSKLTWIVEKPAYPLLTMNPHIDEILVFDKPKFRTMAGFIKHGPDISRLLKSRHFDLVLDLQGLFKSAALAWLSGARKKIGYCDMRELSWLVSKPTCGVHRNGHVIERYLDVARYLGCKVTKPQFCLEPSEQDIKEIDCILAASGLNPDLPYVVLAPGTNWQSKCWPAKYYADLATALTRKFKHQIVLIGSPQDDERAKLIQNHADTPIINLIGKTTLKQLACVLQKSKLFIGGDTGPLHLAAAMGARTVALFGPSDADRNGPYGDKHVVIRKNLTCSPCFKRNCDDLQCMEQITVSDVFDCLVQQKPLAEGSLKGNCLEG